MEPDERFWALIAKTRRAACDVKMRLDLELQVSKNHSILQVQV